GISRAGTDDRICGGDRHAAGGDKTDVRIVVDTQQISGKLLTPETTAVAHPALLFVSRLGRRPKRELNLDADLSAYRSMRLSPAENRVLTAPSRFAGDVLVVESEHDTVIPHSVVENYLRAFAIAAGSVTHSVLRDA